MCTLPLLFPYASQCPPFDEPQDAAKAVTKIPRKANANNFFMSSFFTEVYRLLRLQYSDKCTINYRVDKNFFSTMGCRLCRKP